MNKPEQNKITTPQTKKNEKLTDQQLEQLNAGLADVADKARCRDLNAATEMVYLQDF